MPHGREVLLGEDELIVSKTDLKGRVTYANDVFLRICGYDESEVLGAPHSLIRHPDMPRCVFGLLWEVLESGHEVFAFVKNLTKSGDFYWVFAHVTPTFNSGRIIGYHSNRRAPARAALPLLDTLYEELRTEEAKFPRDQQVAAGRRKLDAILAQRATTYEAFLFSLERMSR